MVLSIGSKDHWRTFQTCQFPSVNCLTPHVCSASQLYGVLATFEIVMWALLPLFYSTPIEFGGLGFTPMTIGLWMSGFGAANGLIQALCFAPLVRQTGAQNAASRVPRCFIPIFALFPIVSWVAKLWGISWVVWALLACQLILTLIMDMAFSA
jgi:hypothetical protein